MSEEIHLRTYNEVGRFISLLNARLEPALGIHLNTGLLITREVLAKAGIKIHVPQVLWAL